MSLARGAGIAASRSSRASGWRTLTAHGDRCARSPGAHGMARSPPRSSSTVPGCGRVSWVSEAASSSQPGRRALLLVTEQLDGMSADAPIFEDPAAYGYLSRGGRRDDGRPVRPRAAAWRVDGIPRDFSFGEITPDWDRMGPFVERAMARVPATLDVGIRKFFCGPESFLPDLAPAVGEAPGIHGYFVCAGMNSVGIPSPAGLAGSHGALDQHGPAGRRYHGIRRRPVPGLGSSRPTCAATGPPRSSGRCMPRTPRHPAADRAGIHRSPVHEEMVAAGPSFVTSAAGERAVVCRFGRPRRRHPGWGHQPWFVDWAAEHWGGPGSGRALRHGLHGEIPGDRTGRRGDARPAVRRG